MRMNYSNEESLQEVLEALNYADGQMRTLLNEINSEEAKTILAEYSSFDLRMLSDIAMRFEQYEICQSVKDILEQRGETL
jgi:hypothetical protein